MLRPSLWACGRPPYSIRRDKVDELSRILHRLVPGLRDVGRWTTSCVTTYTPSGHPFIDRLGDRTVCSIGGNGYAAKCAPALGELAAGLLLGWDWSTEIDRELFVARFED